MKKCKRLLALLLSAVMIVTFMPFVAFADSEEDADYNYDSKSDYSSDGFRSDTGRVYDGTFSTLTSGGLVCDCYRYGEDEAVVYQVQVGTLGIAELPETIYDAGKEKTRTIVGIIANAETIEEEYSTGKYLYERNHFHSTVANDLKQLILPSTIEFIGQGALYSCDTLEKLTFKSSGDYTIEGNAFTGCTSLESVEFSSESGAFAHVDIMAFKDCTGLTSINFPDDSEVDEEALEGCFNLQTITNAPGSLIFYSDTFEDNWPMDDDDNYVIDLREISFHEGEEKIYGSQSYRYDQYITAPYLSYIHLPSTAKYIEGFSGTAIEEIALPDGLEKIGNCCFEGCSSLRKAEFPDSLEYVGSFAFAGCTNLNISVNHPGALKGDEYYNSGVTDITVAAEDMNDPDAWYFFRNDYLTKCPNLKSINIIGNSDYFKSVDGVLYTSFSDSETGGRVWALLRYPPAKSSGSYTIPSDAVYIAAYAFEGCKFDEIHIPVTVKGIKNQYQYEKEDEADDYPFSTMASNATVYYVKNSYMDTDYITGSERFKKYNNLKTENGPEISITYDLDGGTNDAANPTSMIAGTSIELKDPRKTGYNFSWWEEYKYYYYGNDASWYMVDSTITPTNGQLVNGLKLKAHWSEAGSGSSSGTTDDTASDKIKGVTTVTVNTKTVNAAAITKAIMAAGGSKDYVTKVVLGAKVKAIKANTFKGTKVTTVEVKTKKLKAKKVKNSLKGSSVKTIKVKVGNSKLNKKYKKVYKKIFTKKNAGKKVKIK